MASDLIYRDNEWQIDGVLICADIELIITVDMFEGEPTVFELYLCTTDAKRVHTHRWIEEAMKSWTAANQATLRQAYYDRRPAPHF